MCCFMERKEGRMSLLVKDEKLGKAAWRRRARIASGRLLFASLAVVSVALAVAVTGAAGAEMGQYLVLEVLSLYVGPGVPWLLITVAFGATGEIVDCGSGLSGAVVGNLILAAIGFSGWLLIRAAPICELALVAALDHPDAAAVAAAALTASLTAWLSVKM